MQHYNPTKPLTLDNYAIQVDYYLNGESGEKCARFGSAKEFAEWMDSFDYSSGDITGWTGDSATMQAVNSYRNDRPYRAIPEFITEFNTNDGSSEIVGADQFHNLRRMFTRDRDNYRVYRHYADDAKVYSVMYVGKGDARLSSYVWHVPFGADEIPIS